MEFIHFPVIKLKFDDDGIEFSKRHPALMSLIFILKCNSLRIGGQLEILFNTDFILAKLFY